MILGNILNEIISNEPTKCCGFRPGIINFYSKLACHNLSDLNIIIENKALHHADCCSSEYKLKPGFVTANKMCSDLEFSPKLKNIIDRCMVPYGDGMKHIYLSHNYQN